MVTFEDLGVALQAFRSTPGNTVITIPESIWSYTRYRLDFDDGDQEFVAGDWIVGATSGAIAKVVSIENLSEGTWTNETGYFILDSWNGTAFQDNEEIKVAAQATAANVNGTIKPLTDNYPYKGMVAKAALIVVLANTVLFDFSGGIPDQTSLIGIPIIANGSLVVRSQENVKHIKFLDRVAASAGTVDITFFF